MRNIMHLLGSRIYLHLLASKRSAFLPLLFLVLCMGGLEKQVSAQKNDNFEWVKRMGGSGYNYAFGNAVDNKGFLYFTGGFQNTANLGSLTLTSKGNSDILITKMDSLGNFLWAKGMGSADQDLGYSVTPDNQGNIYVVGVFLNKVDFGSTTLISAGKEDAFICKLTDAGTILWAKSMGGTGSDEAMSVTIDDNGDLYIAGHFEGTANFGTTSLISSGGSDAFIAKMDKSGNFLWAKSAGGSMNDNATDIASDSKGNLYVSGSFNSTANFGGNSLTSAGRSDGFVCKIDKNGNFLWAKGMGGPNDDNATSISTDAQGNVYLTGSVNGAANNTISFGQIQFTVFSLDIFNCKLDANGTFLWADHMGGVNMDCGGEVLTSDANGNTYTTGWYTGTMKVDAYTLISNGQWDVFVCKKDNTGKIVWLVSVGGPKWEVGQGISVDARNNLYITGYFQEKVDFDPGNAVEELSSIGSYDGFVLKLSSLCASFKSDVKASSNEPLCIGDTLKLKAAPSGSAYVYRWEGPDGFTSILQNPVIPNVSFMNSGYYVLAVTNKEGCKDGLIMPVTVNSIPTITASSNSPVCEGDTLNLLASGGGSFIWKGPNGYNSSQHFPNVQDMNIADSGTYTVTVTNDGCSDSSSVNVTVNPLPVADFSVTVSGNTVTITNNKTSPDATYYWDYGDGKTSGNNNSIHEHKFDFDNSAFTIMLVAMNECGADTLTKTVNMTTGVSDQNNTYEISVYPNPFTDDVNLKISLPNGIGADLAIYDLAGRKIYGLPKEIKEKGLHTISFKQVFRDMPAGIYMLNIMLDNGERMMRKVVKVK